MYRFVTFPKAFFIEPTNDCNLTCSMCPRTKSRKPVGYMSLELFCDVVKQLAQQKVVSLDLHMAGEPLLHPQILDMIRYAKKTGLEKVCLTTNGTLLTEELARGLLESGLDHMTVSMDTSSAERYCPGHKAKEAVAHLDQNVVRLLELRNRQHRTLPKVMLRIIRMETTQDLIPGFVKKWEQVVDKIDIKDLLSWAGHIHVPGKKQRRGLLCANHLVQGVVLWDGDVSFCCLYIDSTGDAAGILGNAAKASLEEIFFGEKRKKIIEAQLRGAYDIIPYCKHCTDWADFTEIFRQVHKEGLRNKGPI